MKRQVMEWVKNKFYDDHLHGFPHNGSSQIAPFCLERAPLCTGPSDTHCHDGTPGIRGTIMHGLASSGEISGMDSNEGNLVTFRKEGISGTPEISDSNGISGNGIPGNAEMSGNSGTIGGGPGSSSLLLFPSSSRSSGVISGRFSCGNGETKPYGDLSEIIRAVHRLRISLSLSNGRIVVTHNRA
jgi:hypothetical protein